MSYSSIRKTVHGRQGDRALFLDRDGIINEDHGYVYRIEDVSWTNGIFDLCRSATKYGFRLIIVTNQSGIGRGYYTQKDFETLNNWMLTAFEREGAPISKVYHCPHHPDAKIKRYRHAKHPWRKPEPGMLLAARDKFGLSMHSSVFIGDNWSDMEAGSRAGVGTLALVGQHQASDDPVIADRIHHFSTVAEFASWFTERYER